MAKALEEEGLSRHTCEVLEERLAAVRNAVVEYEDLGLVEMTNACHSLVGTIATDQEIRNNLKANGGTANRLRTAVLTVIATLTAAMTFANTGADTEQKFLPMIQHLLLPAPGVTHSPISTEEPSGLSVTYLNV